MDCRNIVEEKLPEEEEDLLDIPNDIFIAEEQIQATSKQQSQKSSECEFVLTKDKKVDIVTN